ncbi:MAG TPA: ADP-ribosylglycohydrolase family protein [Marmoricola sp.]
MVDEPTEEAVWHDRVLGLLLGGALGDAVGAPFEGALQVHPSHVDRVLAGPEPLRWTDDTALQVALADYLAAHAGDAEVVDDDLVMALADAWRADPDRGYGPNPPRIFAAALAGDDWRAHVRGAFGGGGSLGNGGAMRAAPVGVIPGGVRRIAEVARRSAAVTHAHPVGQEAAAAVAVAVHWGLRARQRPEGPEEVLAYCTAAVSTQELRNRLRAVRSVVGCTDPREAAMQTGNGVAAHESVGAALTAALTHPDDPVAAISYAVRMAGDTDTIAAIAGSIVGAWTGAQALPEGLVGRLEDRARIQDVAARLAASTWR